MQETINRMLKSIETAVKDESFINRHKKEKQDFSRNRNLSFGDITNFVIGNLGTGMDFEVLHFCGDRHKSVSSAAVSKARDKIKYTAFEEIFRRTAQEAPTTHTYRGYRLIAFDGMQGELPKTKELMLACKAREKDNYPLFHAIAAYDVLNCCYINAIFNLGETDERKAALKLLESHDGDGAEIFLLDRGFPSLQLLSELRKSGKHYVIRVSKSFLKEVNDFGKSTAKDEVMEINYDKRRGATNRVSGVEFPFLFQLRCVKIELNNGEDEILVTNLEKETFSRKDIGELYNLRWKIETGFLNLKYAVCIEDFMGKKENSLKQEFFASLTKSNIYMQFVEAANDILYNKKNDKTRI